MKLFSMILAGMILVSANAFADNHGTCAKDGKTIEAKDEAACNEAGGTWTPAKK